MIGDQHPQAQCPRAVHPLVAGFQPDAPGPCQPVRGRVHPHGGGRERAARQAARGRHERAAPVAHQDLAVGAVVGHRAQAPADAPASRPGQSLVLPRGPAPDVQGVRALAQAFAAARCPVIVCTASGVDPATVAPLVALCERFGIGVAEARQSEQRLRAAQRKR